MNNLKTLLENYRDLRISRTKFENEFSSVRDSDSNEIVIEIRSAHVIHLLHLYMEGKVSHNDLMHWVNLVMFSDYFDYYDNECDSISSVVSALEESDDNNQVLVNRIIESYIEALKSNQEI